MADNYKGKALGALDIDNLTGCIAATDAALKAANVTLQGIVTKKLKSGGCVILRGDIADINAAMEAAQLAAKQHGKITNYTIIASPTQNDEELFALMVRQ